VTRRDKRLVSGRGLPSSSRQPLVALRPTTAPESGCVPAANAGDVDAAAIAALLRRRDRPGFGPIRTAASGIRTIRPPPAMQPGLRDDRTGGCGPARSGSPGPQHRARRAGESR